MRLQKKLRGVTETEKSMMCLTEWVTQVSGCRFVIARQAVAGTAEQPVHRLPRQRPAAARAEHKGVRRRELGAPAAKESLQLRTQARLPAAQYLGPGRAHGGLIAVPAALPGLQLHTNVWLPAVQDLRPGRMHDR